jgi:hypothetical protein
MSTSLDQCPAHGHPPAAAETLADTAAGEEAFAEVAGAAMPGQDKPIRLSR